MKEESGSKLNNKPHSFAADRFFRFAGIGAKIRNFTSRRFDESIFINVAGWMRQFFFRLRLRVIGTFLLTFGVYAAVVAVLISIFREKWVAGANLYSGLLFALLSIPLLISRGNISTALLYSRLGSTLCDFLGIRRESLHDDAFSGRVNVAFVLGVLAGMLTLWVSPVSIAAWFVVAVGVGVVFALPENGIMALSVLLLLAGQTSQLWTLAITLVSYFLKLLRGKRSLCFYRRDMFAALVLLTVIGGGILNPSGVLPLQTGVYALFICTYFLATLILYDFRKINRIITALYIGEGVLAAMYLVGAALQRYLVGSFVRDAGFLIQFVLKLPVFREGLASILFMALIPFAVSGCLRSNLIVPRHTSIFCVITMTVALVFCSTGPEVLCACISVMLLLILYWKRTGFFILDIILAIFVSLIYLTGSFGNYIYTFFARQAAMLIRGIQNSFTAAMQLDIAQFFAGSGLTSDLLNSVQIFYIDYIQSFGLIGLLIFTVFIIVLIGTGLQFLKKTFEEEHVVDELLRFGVARSPADMRLGSGASLCSIAALLLCGTVFPGWQNSTAAGLFWMICGISAAYVKSASREIKKADQAVLFDLGPESAFVSLKRKKNNQGGFHDAGAKTKTQYN